MTCSTTTAKNPTEFQSILAAEFNSITPENDMKWAEIHPEPDVYDFSGADAVVAFAKANNQEVRGHTLLWHSQNPQWVIDAAPTWTCEEARDVLEDHVRTVVGRYAGDIYEWDVANEIFQDDWDAGGVQLRTGINPFLNACSDDPVALIGDLFRWAHEADPEARALPQRLQRRGHQQQDQRLLRPGRRSCWPTACRSTAWARRVT